MFKKISLIVACFITMLSVADAAVISIDNKRKVLTLIQDDGYIIEYPIAVGRDGLRWKGQHVITRKEKWPTWTPSPSMRKRNPSLPVRVSGGPDNPLGARALYLGNTLYRIHGTNDPSSIGRASSSGCFRMYNEDVIDLYNRVSIGTLVIVD
jgi:lipoprotein-anchoring transpeptidase ErfK/SrfK